MKVYILIICNINGEEEKMQFFPSYETRLEAEQELKKHFLTYVELECYLPICTIK